MNKLIIPCLICLLASTCVGQVTDTLGYADFVSGTKTLYESPNGGFAFGNNGYGDRAKAQAFSHDESYVVREVYLDFGSVSFGSADSSSSISVDIYTSGGLGVTLNSVNDPIAPDSLLISTEVPVYELTESGLNVVDVSSETIVIQPNERFFVSVDFSSLAEGDTLGLNSTQDGDAATEINAWELTSDSVWVVVAQPAYSWDLDVDLGIFVGVDVNDPAGVDSYANQFGVELYPNPATDFVNVRVQNQYSSGYSYRIHSTDGRLFDKRAEVLSQFSIDVGSLTPGLYSLVVEHEGSISVEQFSVTH